MFEFSVNKDMKKKDNDLERVPTLLLTMIVKESKTSVQQGRVVTT